MQVRCPRREPPRPDPNTYLSVVSELEASLDRAAQLAPNPGRPLVHRLNRLEYRNAIRDLLGLELDEKVLLPPDSSSHGFDNIADVLTFSPGLIERYLLEAQRISALALGNGMLNSATHTYDFPIAYVQEDRLSVESSAGLSWRRDSAHVSGRR